MDLQYPIGKFQRPAATTSQLRAQWISDIAAAPGRLRTSVAGLTDEQLDTPYRPEGWTVRQVVHHLADSHVNSYVRFRLALTEDQPSIKAYDEKLWAGLPDAEKAPVEISLRLLDSLHERWVLLLRQMSDADFARTFHHSEVGLIDLGTNLALYSWHCRHHEAHITSLLSRMGWEQGNFAAEAD
jgi:uncharacterized damage-inducible protein DinB